MAERQAGARLRQLDGLRGLAALSVFFLHTFELITKGADARDLPVWPFLRPLWDGAAAVVLFFVLSGFVLSLPYVSSTPKRIDVAPFLIRRVTRLYPAYWLGILLALFLRFAVYAPHGLNGLTPWVAELWSAPIGWGSLVRHFVLIAPRLQFMQLDPVIWSLAVEVKISFIFPAVLYLVQKTRRVPYALLVIGLVFGCTFFGFLGNLFFFLCGSYLAKYRSSIVAALSSSRWLLLGLCACAYATYGASWSMPFLSSALQGGAVALGSCLLIALFLSSHALARFGALPPMQFLGDASYSFYLIHFPILLALTSWIYPRTHSVLLSAVVSLVCSLGIAYVIYVLVEVPCQNWGRRQAKSVGDRMAAYAAARHRAATHAAGPL
jgi:peptidoglycan/LPS O-acetylase OafA/YrhL